MVRYSPTWKAFRRQLLRLSRGSPTREQVWTLLAESHWLRGKLSTLNLPPLVLTECLYQLAHAISHIAPITISAWDLRDLINLIAQHARDAQVAATAFQVGSPKDLRARITLLRTLDVLPPRQRAVLTLHLKGLSLTAAAQRMRLSTYVTYATWREGTQALLKIISAT